MELSALGWSLTREKAFAELRAKGWTPARVAAEDKHHYGVLGAGGYVTAQVSGKLLHERSEEHTSELQSHSEISYAVFCLKKKKK